MFALSGSLILSLTVIPVLAYFLLRKMSHEEPWLPRTLHRLYEPALNWCLEHARIVLIAAGALLALTALVYTQIGKTLMPIMDEGDIIVQVEKLPSITLDQSGRLDKRIQQAILASSPAWAPTRSAWIPWV